jgi:hypothetical protein
MTDIIDNPEIEVPIESKTKVKQNNQIKFIVILMLICIGILIFIPLYTEFFVNSFSYNNIEYHKIKEGNLPIYTAKIPVNSPKDMVTGSSVADSYIIRLRNAPRLLDKIPEDKRINEDGIKFISRNKVYISIDPDINKCSDNTLAVMTLAGYLKDSNLEIKSASPNPVHANESSLPYVTCMDSSSNTVLLIKSGSETRINQKSTNCYELIFKECEILSVVERFILTTVEQHVSRIS